MTRADLTALVRRTLDNRCDCYCLDVDDERAKTARIVADVVYAALWSPEARDWLEDQARKARRGHT